MGCSGETPGLAQKPQSRDCQVARGHVPLGSNWTGRETEAYPILTWSSDSQTSPESPEGDDEEAPRMFALLLPLAQGEKDSEMILS